MATRGRKKSDEDAGEAVGAEHQSPILRGQFPIPIEELQPFESPRLSWRPVGASQVWMA
jgi:hypothetical protein